MIMTAIRIFHWKRFLTIVGIIIILCASLTTFLVTNVAHAEPLPGCRYTCPTPTPTNGHQDGPVSTPITCAQSPISQNCDDEDPVLERCAGQGITNVTTDAQVPLEQNGKTIGLIERRYSPTCNSYWARVTDLLFPVTGEVPGGNISIQVGNLPALSGYDNGIQEYSNMVFGQKPLVLAAIFYAPGESISATIPS